MNGASYDKSLKTIEGWKSLAETDSEDYCKNALLVFESSGITQPKYNKICQNLKQRINEKKFDKETVDLARTIIDQANNVYSNGLSRAINGYNAQIFELLEQIRKTAKTFFIANNFLQLIIIIGASSVPFLLNMPMVNKTFPTVVSAMVAIAAALNNQFKFRQQGSIHQHIAEEIKREYNLHVTERGIYNTLPRGAALDHFMDRIDDIRREQHELLVSLHKTSQDISKDQIQEVRKLGVNKS